MKFRLEADCIFYAKDIDECLQNISKHFNITKIEDNDDNFLGGKIEINPIENNF